MKQSVKLKEITTLIEEFAPLRYQEGYDNSGLLYGDSDNTITGVILCLDITESVVDEAIEKGCNLIVSHHPLVFSGIKKLNTNNYINKTLIKAIKNDIALYSCHTNMDSVVGGVSYTAAQKLSLKNIKTLVSQGNLCKLIVYTPTNNKDEIRALMTKFGGNIGNYSNCSFSYSGEGTFMGNDNSTPSVGNKNQLTTIDECAVSMIIERQLISRCISEVKKIHPYQEVGYDIINVENSNSNVGLGVIGELDSEVEPKEFLSKVSKQFNCKSIRHTSITNKSIKRVAICGGSGASLISNAISAKADIYLTGDIKYHDFFIDENQIILADIGHFESEICILDVFYDIISKKIPTFAIHYSTVSKNPVNYFID